MHISYVICTLSIIPSNNMIGDEAYPIALALYNESHS